MIVLQTIAVAFAMFSAIPVPQFEWDPREVFKDMRLVADLGHPRHHPQDLLHGAHLADLLKLLQEVIKSQISRHGLRGHLFSSLLINLLLSLLDQGEDIAHVEDATRHAVGVKTLEVIKAFTGRRKEDRRTGHATN